MENPVQTNENGSPSFAPALERGIRILDIVRRLGSCSVSRIVAESGLPRSSAYVLVGALAKYEILRQKDNGEYQLWTRALMLGLAASDSIGIDTRLAACLDRLVEGPGADAACFVVRDGFSARCAITRVRPGAASPFPPAGGKVELRSGALGWCLEAFYGGRDRSGRPEPTPSVRLEIERIRARGWACDHPRSGGPKVLASPVADHRGNLLGVLAVSGSGSQFAPSGISAAAMVLKNTCADLARGLG
jgi:DNA-binding IclR family transcriptional regulator